MSGVKSEAADGGVIGNVYDKYGTKNPIARYLMKGFLEGVTSLYRRTGARTVLEVGCGEGKLAHHLVTEGGAPERFVATDVEVAQVHGVDPRIEVRAASAYELPFADRSFELVVCCEVLEHLERPMVALAELARVASRAVIVSTPREPLWRALNMARGKYLAELGNTPGHIQHYSRRDLLLLCKTHLDIVEVKNPVPWTMLLGEPRR